MQEIELKFLVPEYKIDSLMRQAKVKTSTTTQLAAHYFDTSDNILANSGMALRIRKEGDTWVQTLKSTGDGMVSRGEQNNILNGDKIEEALKSNGLYPDLSVYEDSTYEDSTLSKLLPSSSKDDQSHLLNLKYITDIQRTTRLIKKDNNVIEMAYDEGHVIHGDDVDVSHPILELEFELLEGDLAFLFSTAKTWCKRYNLCISTVTKAERGDLLLAGKTHADATKSDLTRLRVDGSMSQPEFLKAVIQNCMIQILPNVSAIATGSKDGNHIHQLRVGLRRLRTALKFFEGFSSQINPEWVPILKQTFSILGESRDREILRDRTQVSLEKLGGPHVDWSSEIENIDVLPIDAIQANDFQLTLLELIEFTMSPSNEDHASNNAPLTEATSQILEKLYKQIRKASVNFATLDIESQHDVRKRLKSLRYVIEFVRPLYKKKKTDCFLKYLEPAQEILGEYNDDIVGEEFYRAKTDKDPNAWFAVGYFSAQKYYAAQKCTESLKTIKEAPVFW